MDVGERKPRQELSFAKSAEGTQGKEIITTENCPQPNGTIESACKQVNFFFRAVLSELKKHKEQWPEVVHLEQSVLNNYLSTRLNNRTPKQVFTGHAETNPLALLLKRGVRWGARWRRRAQAWPEPFGQA
jgi:hypothetical protein